MRRKKRTTTSDSSTMADLAFLLIVFFLITSTIEMQNGIGLVLPDGDNVIKIAPENLLKVYLNDKQILFDGNEIARYEVPRYFREVIIDNENIVLTINSSTRSTNYEEYLYVLDEARFAGIRKISVL